MRIVFKPRFKPRSCAHANQSVQRNQTSRYMDVHRDDDRCAWANPFRSRQLHDANSAIKFGKQRQASSLCRQTHSCDAQCAGCRHTPDSHVHVLSFEGKSLQLAVDRLGAKQTLPSGGVLAVWRFKALRQPRSRVRKRSACVRSRRMSASVGAQMVVAYARSMPVGAQPVLVGGAAASCVAEPAPPSRAALVCARSTAASAAAVITHRAAAVAADGAVRTLAVAVGTWCGPMAQYRQRPFRA